MEAEIINMAHNQGNSFAKKTQEAVEKTFYILNLRAKTAKVEKSFVECIINYAKIGRKEGFLKCVLLYPTKNTGAEAVVECLKKQAAVFGNTGRIITDRGAALKSNIFKGYCKRDEIQHLLIATGSRVKIREPSIKSEKRRSITILMSLYPLSERSMQQD